MSEIIYYGDATLLKRPKWEDKNAEDKFYKYYYNKIYRKIAFGDMTPSKKYLYYQKKRGRGVYNFFSKTTWGFREAHRVK